MHIKQPHKQKQASQRGLRTNMQIKQALGSTGSQQVRGNVFFFDRTLTWKETWLLLHCEETKSLDVYIWENHFNQM